jgi:hypothetical protein
MARKKCQDHERERHTATETSSVNMQPTATVVTRHYYSAVPVNMLSHSEAFLVYVTAMPVH